MGGLTSSPGPRTRPRNLRRLYIRRSPPRRCGIDNAMVLLAPYSHWTLKANTPVSTLVRARYDRLDEMLLLLTLLEV